MLQVGLTKAIEGQEEPKIGKHKEVYAYATAEEYKLEDIMPNLRQEGQYEEVPVPTDLLGEVLILRCRSEPDNGPSFLYLFR